MCRIRAFATLTALFASGGAFGATGTSDVAAAAGSVVDRCYTVWSTASDADLDRLDKTLRAELAAQTAALEAQENSIEAEIALLEERLSLLSAGLGTDVAEAAAAKTVGTPQKSATALGRDIVATDAAGSAAEVAAVSEELAEARARLAAATQKRLEMPAQESGLTRCVDDHRARMASAAAVSTAAAPVRAPAPEPVAAPPPPPAVPAPAPAPEIAEAPETVAAAPEATPPAGWDGTLEGWYEGECSSLGKPSYDFRNPLTFNVVYQGPVEGVVFWSVSPRVAGYGYVAGTTGRPVSGLMDNDGTVMVSTVWQGLLVFSGVIDGNGHGQGMVRWERPYELCVGTWAAD